jgi:putative transposase
LEADEHDQKNTLENRRREMVVAVRRGESLRSVAARFGVSVPTVTRWVLRAQGKRLDRTSFSDQSTAPRHVHNRTGPAMEKLVLGLRQQLRDQSDLGEFGAAAIRRELTRRGISHPPSLRTIGYILERHGALDYRRRIRRPAPPAGWYLPEVAGGLAEIDEFDFVEGLLIRGGIEVEVLNVVSLHGGLVGSWPESGWTTALALGAILEHWRRFGLPDYAQFDNDNRFSGPHQHQDAIGRVIRVCLSLGVRPVFAPPREHGLQNAIESYNGKWQAKVWARWHYETLEQLQGQSGNYVEAHRARSRARIERAPQRRAFPKKWKFDPQAKIKRGVIIFIRRSTDKGMVEVLGRPYAVDTHWVNRLVRCEVDIAGKEIRFYGLRRREPAAQPLVGRVGYELPRRYVSE